MSRTCTESDIRRWRASTVDDMTAARRVARVRKRSIKTESKVRLLKLALSMVDLTTLEGRDSPERVRALCRKAQQPYSPRPDLPSCAAVCVYPSMVSHAREALGQDSPIKVAAVATAFPSGQLPIALKLEEVRRTVGLGADEIDMVINRGAFLAGEYARVFDSRNDESPVARCQGERGRGERGGPPSPEPQPPR